MIEIKQLAQAPYQETWQAMRDLTDTRNADTPDQFWCLEHEPVFTQGQAGRPEHILDAGDIPVLQTDRGGQVTYHGPGQLIIYILLDLKRRGMTIKPLVNGIEQAVIDMLAAYDIEAQRKPGAPGVYVNDAKICALGLRVRRGCSYHGLALNVNMDLAPFSRINPCGYEGMQVTQCTDLGGPSTVAEAQETLLPILKGL
jgi:lipoyl(octanoyl) transferase